MTASIMYLIFSVLNAVSAFVALSDGDYAKAAFYNIGFFGFVILHVLTRD